jgi:hypothetical protein
MFLAAWACESGCFANNPQPDLQEGLGEMDIKPETIRFVVCVTRKDASINVEDWILRKVSEGMRATINNGGCRAKDRKGAWRARGGYGRARTAGLKFPVQRGGQNRRAVPSTASRTVIGRSLL